MQKFDFYRMKDGNCPIERFLDSLDDKMRAKLFITRALYFFVVGHKIILTNGFIKKDQKTPKNEIDLAKKYRTDFMKGKGNLS